MENSDVQSSLSPPANHLDEDTLAGLDTPEHAIISLQEAAEEEDAFSDNGGSSSATPNQQSLRNVVVELPSSTLVTPRSLCPNFEPPAPMCKEWQAVENLLLKFDDSHHGQDYDYVEFELDNFSVYIDSKSRPSQLWALHKQATFSFQKFFYFDGVLSVDNVRHYVQRVPFDKIPMGNYGTLYATVGDQLWIQSKYAQGRKSREIYYRLKNPSTEYKRFYRPFLWVADLTKHCVDYCTCMIAKGLDISIRHFESSFSAWLLETHQNSPSFQAWHAQRGGSDFRQSVIANRDFIYKETFGLLGAKDRSFLKVFHEINTFDKYKPQGAGFKNCGEEDPPNTIVTPYIYDLFSHMDPGQLLQPCQPSVSTEKAISPSWPENGLTTTALTRRARHSTSHDNLVAGIRPGDVISTPPDDREHTDTAWRTCTTPNKAWYGLAQKVHVLKDNSRCFDVIWLYQPEDTPCCSMKYPYGKEMFLSTHCSCNGGKESKIHENEVLKTHTVEWFGSPDTGAEFFIRQTYVSEQRQFVTLKRSHIHCHHEEQERTAEFRQGDTVLALLDTTTNTLEPCELVRADSKQASLRVLLRRNQVDPRGRHCPLNELVYTDEIVTISVSRIKARCIVRFFCPDEPIPTPYDRNGAGNAFFIIYRKLDGSQFVPIGRDRPAMKQGFDPTRGVSAKLRALDLFSGCGNFGRGVEDSGAVEAHWANDIWDVAVHTYMSNTKSPFTRFSDPSMICSNKVSREGSAPLFRNLARSILSLVGALAQVSPG